MNVPPQAIQPLRARLAELRLIPVTDVTDAVRTNIAIAELEALITRLENPNVSRTA